MEVELETGRGPEADKKTSGPNVDQKRGVSSRLFRRGFLFVLDDQDPILQPSKARDEVGLPQWHTFGPQDGVRSSDVKDKIRNSMA